MPESYTTKSGQKVTTFFNEAAESEAREKDTLTKQEARRQLNRDKRAEQEGVFKTVVRALNPTAPAAARESGRNAVKTVKAAVPSMLDTLGQNVGRAARSMSGPPVWLYPPARVAGRAPGQQPADGRRHPHGLPPWVMGHGSPFDRPQRGQFLGPDHMDHGEVVKVVVTRTHADGSKTRSYRTPRRKPEDPLTRFSRMPY